MYLSNPSRSGVVIRFTTGAPSVIDVKVYDVLGRVVRTTGARRFDAGSHELSFGLERDRRGLASGVYFVVLEGADWRVHTKSVLVR